MEKKKTIKVGSKEIEVDDATYAASRSEMERVKKKKQRLRKDGIDYAVKSLTELYDESEFEPDSGDRVEDSVFSRELREQLWKAVNDALDDKDALIITEYYKKNRSESAIAAQLGITQQAVSKRRKKAEGFLAVALRDFKIFLE
ncbi:hypothetical protein FACS1894208_06320 [Clostridia bacterium]|nr:hypothetical protein FACS1894208_06320 [Clostridia bacterium]